MAQNPTRLPAQITSAQVTSTTRDAQRLFFILRRLGEGEVADGC
jgi:hypothetical protein